MDEWDGAREVGTMMLTSAAENWVRPLKFWRRWSRLRVSMMPFGVAFRWEGGGEGWKMSSVD
jgi:hypothetical protein